MWNASVCSTSRSLQRSCPGKRRVDFSAPVPPSKRAWVVPGIGAGWLRWLAQGEREAREAEAAAAAVAAAEAEAEAAAERCR